LPSGALLLGAAVLAGTALVIGGVAAYLLLPSASIVVTPREELVGPEQVTVTADPEATAVDTEAGVVPAQRPSFEVAANGTYAATGERVVEAKASGTVRWTNCDPTASHTIPAGAVVRTRDGVRFATTERVFLPVAILELTPPSISCQERDVNVVAAEAGPAGNVAPGTITVVPSDVNSNVIAVNNPAATAGGTRDTFPKVTAEDVAAATTDLETRLDAAFASALAAPDAVAPGLTLFAETAALGDTVYDVDPQTFVDQEVAEFTLAASAIGTAVAVDEAPVAEVAEARLVENLEPGYDLVADSVESTIGDPTVSGQTVIFPASATARQVRQLDPAALEEMVLGLSKEEAEAQLEPYGDVEISLWPDWATAVPTYAFRVDVSVGDAGPIVSPAPAASPTS
jgi:hypothetical protein